MDEWVRHTLLWLASLGWVPKNETKSCYSSPKKSWAFRCNQRWPLLSSSLVPHTKNLACEYLAMPLP